MNILDLFTAYVLGRNGTPKQIADMHNARNIIPNSRLKAMAQIARQFAEWLEAA